MMLGLDQVGFLSYVELVLCLDALAARGERRDRPSYLEPFPQVGLELESDVRFGVVAVAVPGGGHGVQWSGCVVRWGCR